MKLDDIKLEQGEYIMTDGGSAKVVDKNGRITKSYNIGPMENEVWPVNELHSKPPPGYLRVTNLYVDPTTHKLIVEYDDGV